MVNSHTRIKMCGLWREEDIVCANMILPDYIGFVFAPSTRQVSKDSARVLKDKLTQEILAVGVFVQECEEMIVELAKEGIIDIIQLHNSFTDEGRDKQAYNERETKIARLRTKTNIPIIKAVGVYDANSIIAQQHSCADWILLDNTRGGSGECFLWDHITKAKEMGFSRAFFLAGGLNADNLNDALHLAPFGIDLSKGLESNGTKDCAKMRTVADITRTHDSKSPPLKDRRVLF